MPVLRNTFIVVFLALQLALPVRPLLQDRYDSRGHFSWNMYSQNYHCSARYTLTTPSGTTTRIKHEKHFKRSTRANMIWYRDVLPSFHRYLCEYYARKDELQSLSGDVRCSWNGAPSLPLVDPAVDLCRAENYGVPPP